MQPAFFLPMHARYKLSYFCFFHPMEKQFVQQWFHLHQSIVASSSSHFFPIVVLLGMLYFLSGLYTLSYSFIIVRDGQKIADFLPILSIYFRLSINFYWKLRLLFSEDSCATAIFFSQISLVSRPAKSVNFCI